MPKTKTQFAALTLLYGLFAAAAVGLLSIALQGPMTLTLNPVQLPPGDLNLAIRLDALSTITLLMVAFLGIVVGQYCVRYLDGERHQDAFFRRLCFTVFSVAVFVTASNLVALFVAWLAMSVGLHRLLLFYPDRPNAVAAAWKKFFVSRVGDLFLLIGIVLVYRAFGTFEFQQIFELSQRELNPQQSVLISWSGIFFVCGAMTKSAQFPFHFWLPETMETPTPVSALMHAGIINAGGFLLIRLSPLITHASYASLILAVVGAITGVFASLVMVTQNDIKRKLAYSTISQMGLMMFACGIGAYTFAFFHILAHSFYKAHAFLSTGELIEESKKISIPIAPQTLWKMLLFTLFGLGLIVTGLSWENGRHVPELTYLAVLFLGLAQNREALHTHSKIGALVLLGIAVTLTVAGGFYATLESLVRYLTSSEIVIAQAQVGATSPLFIICVAGYSIFAVGFYLANELIQAQGRFQERLYVYFWNGGYFGVRSHRILRAWGLI